MNFFFRCLQPGWLTPSLWLTGTSGNSARLSPTGPTFTRGTYLHVLFNDPSVILHDDTTSILCVDKAWSRSQTSPILLLHLLSQQNTEVEEHYFSSNLSLSHCWPNCTNNKKKWVDWEWDKSGLGMRWEWTGNEMSGLGMRPVTWLLDSSPVHLSSHSWTLVIGQHTYWLTSTDCMYVGLPNLHACWHKFPSMILVLSA